MDILKHSLTIPRFPYSIDALRTLIGDLVEYIMKKNDDIIYLGCLSVGPLIGVSAGISSESLQIGATSTLIGSIPSLLVWLPSYIDKTLK